MNSSNVILSPSRRVMLSEAKHLPLLRVNFAKNLSDDVLEDGEALHFVQGDNKALGLTIKKT